jgi:sugar lactone lactonase YvrE
MIFFFFIKPNKIAEFNGIQFAETFELTVPYADSNFVSMDCFGKNLYLLDGKNEEIIKYPGPITSGKNNPQSWLSETAQRPADGKSIAIDGSLWVLDGDNSLLRYYSGSLQETLTLKIYPEIKSISQMYINKNLSYIFLLEPSQNRIIISDKQGNIVKQIKSSGFDNLLDVAVSGNTMWVSERIKSLRINLLNLN